MKAEVAKIGLADDHVLLRNSLASLLNSFGNCRVTLQASSGQELITQVKAGNVPDIILLDLNMPDMDGYDTAKWMQENFPEVSMIMLSMYDADLALIRMLQFGVKGFLRKDVHPNELKHAIDSVIESGYYYSNNTTGRLVNLFRKNNDSTSIIQKTLLNETEMAFLKLVCTEDTYKQIAQKMNLNPRSVDNLRDNLFTKLEVKSRIGLAMYAIKHGIITM